jgi:membrane-associated protease RseP (regulator of RpoE activity)
MRTRTLSILLIAALGMVGVSSARADQKPSEPRSSHDDTQSMVTTGKARLGIIALEISPELRAHLGAPSDRGVLIDAVQPDSPAARAGLRVGDVVTDVDGSATSSASDVLGAMADRKKGDEIAVTAIRNSKRVELHARLDSDPGPVGQSRRFQRFDQLPQLPGDGNGWFRFDGNSQDMQRAIDELRKRMEQLERRFEHSSPGGRNLERTGELTRI